MANRSSRAKKVQDGLPSRLLFSAVEKAAESTREQKNFHDEEQTTVENAFNVRIKGEPLSFSDRSRKRKERPQEDEENVLLRRQQQTRIAQDVRESHAKAHRDGDDGEPEVKNGGPAASAGGIVNFTITLNGASSLSRTSSDDQIDAAAFKLHDGASSEKVSEEGDASSRKKRKLTRCTFWPACTKGETCEFHHPSENCTYAS